MTPFTRIISVAVPLIVDDIDTDTIIPSREMRSTGRTGLKDGLFAPWRYTDAAMRTPNPDFVLNQRNYDGAQILLGGRNFGCGSSREHAVWAIAEFGFRCIIAQSFAPIFYSNCLRNGVLPVVLGGAVIARLSGAMVTVDLVQRHVMHDGVVWNFDIGDDARTMMIEGLDAIDLTQKMASEISAWLAQDRTARPWIYSERTQ